VPQVLPFYRCESSGLENGAAIYEPCAGLPYGSLFYGAVRPKCEQVGAKSGSTSYEPGVSLLGGRLFVRFFQPGNAYGRIGDAVFCGT
jgi:hypothetical protein